MLPTCTIDPIGPIDPIHPLDPIDPIDPIDQMDRIDPIDPIDRYHRNIKTPKFMIGYKLDILFKQPMLKLKSELYDPHIVDFNLGDG